MKVLQVNCVYNNGSTGKIVHDIHTELQKQGIESVVCYGRGEKISEPNVYKTCGELYSKANHFWSYVTGLMYGGCALSTRRLIRIIEREKPDVVHLHCLNGYFVNIYRLIAYLRDAGIPTVLTLHAEFMHTGNCGHALDCERWKQGCGQCPRLKKETGSFFFDRTHTSWQRMKDAFTGFDRLTVVSVSPWLMERAKQSPILADKKHCVVFNGIDTENVFHPWDAEDLRKKLELEGKKIVFHATAGFNADPDHIKGGYYVLQLAERLKDQPIQFLVAGGYDPTLVVPKNVTLLGQITDQQLLAKYYSLADVTLLTSKRETYSMPVVESLCCGTPVVGFKAGGPESIALPEFSRFVEYGDVDALESAIFITLDEKLDGSELNAQSSEYSKHEMCVGYYEIYQDIIKRVK